MADIVVTAARENTPLKKIKPLADASILVSLGHTVTNINACRTAFDTNVACVTYLFKAMSQLTSCEPQLDGITLSRSYFYASIFTSTHQSSLNGKLQSDQIFQVTYEMATSASLTTQFTFYDSNIFRKSDRLTKANRTLAGTDLTMMNAVSVMINWAGDYINTALERTISTPANLLRQLGSLWRIAGACRHVIYFGNDISVPTVLH